jgi:hypothetical protein
LIFFVMGPLLTLLIAAGIIVRKLPSNVDKYERAAALATGLSWKIGAVEYRKSNHIRLKNVRLFGADSSKLFFAASEVDLIYISGGTGGINSSTGDSKTNRNQLFPGVISFQDAVKNSVKLNNKSTAKGIWGSIKYILNIGDDDDGFWHISVTKSLIDISGGSSSAGDFNSGGDKIDIDNVDNVDKVDNVDNVDKVNKVDNVDNAVELRECFHELLSRMEIFSSKPILIKFDEIDVLATSLKRFKIRFVAGNFYQTESAIRSEWSFFIPRVSETEREHIIIARRRNSRNLSVTLKTGNMPLPCEFIAIFCSPFRILGQYPSRVSGEITAEIEHFEGGDRSEWVYSLQNVFFNDIEIEQIVDGNMPYLLSGQIKGLRVNEALLGGGRLQANGWIDVVDGVIERGLFHRIVDRFSLTVLPAALLDSPRAEYPFTRCIFNYRLQHDGVIFWVEDTGNVFMVNSGDGIQTQPMAVSLPDGSGKLISYHSVLSIFASDAAPIIPLTPFSKYFVPLIPVDEPKKTVPNQSATKNIDNF